MYGSPPEPAALRDEESSMRRDAKVSSSDDLDKLDDEQVRQLIIQGSPPGTPDGDKHMKEFNARQKRKGTTRYA